VWKQRDKKEATAKPLDSGDVKIRNITLDKKFAQTNVSSNPYSAVSLLLLTTCNALLSACSTCCGCSCFRKMIHTVISDVVQGKQTWNIFSSD